VLKKPFSLYTRKKKGSHREECTKLLRCSLNTATAQLGLSYSSVGIVIRLWAVQRYRSFAAGRRGFSILKIVRSFLGPSQLRIQWGPRNIFPEVNPPEHKADRSLLSSEWLRMSGAMPRFPYTPSCLTRELYLAVKLCLKSLSMKIKWKKFTV